MFHPNDLVVVQQSGRTNPPMNLVKRLLRALTFGVLALILLFEEWGWVPLARLLTRLARLPLWARMEAYIAGLPRWGALLIFAVPWALLLPVKLLALWLFAHSQKALGIAILLGAKVLGTAILARLFQLTQPALMRFELFAKWYPRWKVWKDALMAQIRASEPWQWAVGVKAAVKAAWAEARVAMRALWARWGGG